VTTHARKILAYSSRFALNIPQKRLAAGLCPDPLGSLQHSPDSVAVLRRGKEGKRCRKGGKRRRLSLSFQIFWLCPW